MILRGNVILSNNDENLGLPGHIGIMAVKTLKIHSYDYRIRGESNEW